MFCFIPRIAAVLLVVVAGTLAPAAAEERQLNASGVGFVNNGLQGGGQATHLSNLGGFHTTDMCETLPPG